MKRNKHILINLTSEQYNIIESIAEKMQRKNADAVYILLLEALNNYMLKNCDIKSDGFKKLKYRSED